MARAKKAIEIAGVRKLRPYATRHTYATTSLMSGIKPGFLSKQLGHDSPQTTFTYYAKWIDGEADAAEADKFAGFVPVASPREDKLAGATQEK